MPAQPSCHALQALGAVAKRLAWPQFEQLLYQFMKLMKAKPSKPHIRSVCAILDAFHYELPTEEESYMDTRAKVLTAAALEAGVVLPPVVVEYEPDAGKRAATAATRFKFQIQGALIKRILPALHEQLIEGTEVVRAPVALALVRVLKLLPAESERLELPRALQGVCNLLRVRLQRVRDDARAVLVQMGAELGPAYMPYICNVLRSALPDRGFTAHVIGYTVHAVMEAMVGATGKGRRSKKAAAAAATAAAAALAAGGDATQGELDMAALVALGEGKTVPATAADGDADVLMLEGDVAAVVTEGEEAEVDEAAEEGEGVAAALVVTPIPEGALDESLELILPLLEADLFGEVAEAKEVSGFAAAYKEAKRCRANESYELLASCITFGTHINTLLLLVM